MKSKKAEELAAPTAFVNAPGISARSLEAISLLADSPAVNFNLLATSFGESKWEPSLSSFCVRRAPRETDQPSAPQQSDWYGTKPDPRRGLIRTKGVSTPAALSSTGPNTGTPRPGPAQAGRLTTSCLLATAAPMTCLTFNHSNGATTVKRVTRPFSCRLNTPL